MSWVLFSIFAAFVFAVTSIIDKFLLTKWIKEPLILVLILATVGLLISFCIYLFHGFSFLSRFNIILALIGGIFYIFGEIFYYKAVRLEEVSKVVPVIFLSPLFVLILAVVFLGEVFTLVRYLGVFLLVIGAVSISSKNFTRVNFNLAFYLAIFSALMFGLVNVFAKYLLNFADFWTIFSYFRLGSFLAAIPIFFLYSKYFVAPLKEAGLKGFGFSVFNMVLLFFGVLLVTIATALGPVSLVSALTSVQPLFVVFLATVLSVFLPSLLKEEVNKSLIFQKIFAIILIFTGTLLIV